MKKNFFIFGLMATAMVAASCSKSDDNNEPLTMPEGTDDPRVTIVETDANYSDYRNTWCKYAVAVSGRLKTDAETLYKAWDESLEGGDAYKTTFKEAKGDFNGSFNSCIEQIIDGCIDIANEVGESKIGDPRDKWENGKYTEAVYAVESWYSYHSIEDYANNIRSIRNAFNCTYDNQQGSHNLAAYLNAKGEAELAATVNSRIGGAILAIESMAAPFRNHIGNPSVLVAVNACNSLKEVLNTLKSKVEHIDDLEGLKAIVEDYVDVVVLPTYKDLAEKNAALHASVQTLSASTSNAAFEAAANAWMEARGPWETSEAFLFGPVSKLGLDPNMDSWPLDQDAIKNVLSSGNFGSLDWSGEFDEENEAIANAQNIRGFHTLEFLLFKNGRPRTIN